MIVLPPAAPGFVERRLDVDTPEHVAIGYPLADLGSRFTALLLDGLIIGCVLALIWLGPLLLATWFGTPRPAYAGWLLALMVLLTFAVTWGYFVYFEGLRGGRTPGKRWLGIRVVHDGGFPLTVRGAAVRNLVRFVDIQPIPSCLVGGLVMMLHPRTQRLGDLAAGTLVVRESRAIEQLPEVTAPKAEAPPRLGDDEFQTLNGYLARQDGLQPEVRRRIAGRLADRLAHHAEWDRRAESAHEYLDALHRDEAARRAAQGARAGAGSLAAAALVAAQRDAWAAYRELLEQAQKRGLQTLREETVSRFAALYRETAADLARARTYGASPQLLILLEREVAAGHNLLYRPPRHSAKQLGAWFTGGFPALVRRRWKPILLASLIFYLPALIAFTALRLRPELTPEVVPAGMIARAESGHARQAEGLGYVDVPDIFMPVMASGIIANNVQVTFIAFAGGILLGLGTVAVLVFNGVFLGAVAALFATHGLSLYLWSFVLPHGVIELTAIGIAGGAGLWMASAILMPGRRTRREVLAERAREAVSLIGGTAMLLVVAGLIEGFISPAPIPDAAKLTAAALFAIALALYLAGAGRDADARRQAAESGRL